MTCYLFQIDGAYATRPGASSRERIESKPGSACSNAWCFGVSMDGVNTLPHGGRTT
jgi:hypothetical protein